MIFSFQNNNAELKTIHINGATLNLSDYGQPTLFLEVSRAHALETHSIEDFINFFSEIELENIISIYSDDKAYKLYEGNGFILTNVSVNINTDIDPNFEHGLAKNNVIQIFLSYLYSIGGSDVGENNIEGE